MRDSDIVDFDLPTELQAFEKLALSDKPSSTLNQRLVTKTERTILYDRHGPSMWKNDLRAVIEPKDDRFPIVLVVRTGIYSFYTLHTLNGETLPKQLGGSWSNPKAAQAAYDKVLEQKA